MPPGTFQDQIQWLIRKNTPMTLGDGSRPVSGVTVLGPFLTDQVREMVRSGMLEADDELCPENSYWFGLHELAEVKRFLGLDQVVVARPAADEETTEPDLETTQPEILDLDASIDDKTPPGLETGVEGVENPAFNPDTTGLISVKRGRSTPARSAPVPAQPGPAASRPSRPARAPTAQELAEQFQRVVPTAPLAYSNPHVEQAKGGSFLGMEKSRLWALLIVAFIVMALIGVVWVIKSLRP